MKFRHPNRRGIQGPRPKNSGTGFVGGFPLAEPAILPPSVVQKAEAEIDLSRVGRFVAYPDERKSEVYYRD